MKKTISLLLVAVLLVAAMAPAAFAAEHTGTVTVTYTAGGAPFTGFQGYLTYDHEVFELVSVTGLSGGDFIATESIDFAMWAVEKNIEGSIPVMSATFNIKSGATCDTYTFGFTLEDTSNELLESVSISVVGSSITLDHDWVAGTTVDATCTVDGYTPYTCSICGKTKQDTITATGHVADDAVHDNIVDASCTVAGSYDSVVRCAVCGEELSRTPVTGQTLPHDWADATCTAPKTCKVCGVKEGDPLGHNWSDATCTAPKTCSTCGATEGDALGHNWSDATCTNPKTCSVCGATEGAALGHKYNKITDNGDGTHDVACSVCGALDKDNEKCYDGSDADTKCDVCGHELGTSGGEDDDEESENKTGDITPYPVFILMAVAAVVGTAYGFKRKFEI